MTHESCGVADMAMRDVYSGMSSAERRIVELEREGRQPWRRQFKEEVKLCLCIRFP